MPTSPVLGFTYVTPFDPAYTDLWGTPLNNALLALDGEFGTKTVNQNFADKELSRAMLVDSGLKMQAVSHSVAGTLAIDYTLGSWVNLAQSANITALSVTNWPPTNYGGILYIKRTKDASGTTRSITWPTITWLGGDIEPTLTQTTGAIDHIWLWYDGTTIFGSFRAQ